MLSEKIRENQRLVQILHTLLGDMVALVSLSIPGPDVTHVASWCFAGFCMQRVNHKHTWLLILLCGSLRKTCPGTSLVVQWLRIHLPVQRIQIWSLVWENHTCCRATNPCATITEARVPGALWLQQKRPSQWAALKWQQRVAPTCCN